MAENALKRELGYMTKTISDEKIGCVILDNTSADNIKEIEAKLSTVQVDHWLSLLCRVIETSSKKVTLKLLEETSSSKGELFLFSPFSLTKTSEVFKGITSAFETLNVVFNG